MKKQYRFALNLQQFADGDDDGFDDTPTDDSSDDFDDDFDSSDEQPEDTEQTEAEDTTPTDGETETTEPPATDEWGLPIKYNGEDRVLTKEEAQALAQKGMNYEKAIERATAEAAQKARDSYIAEQGYEDWQGRPITTEAEYKAAVAEQELMRKYQNLPDELREEIMAGRRDREERAKEREANEAKAKNDAEVSDFLAAFQELHERPFDGSKDIIPDHVWAAQRKGKALSDAYMAHHVKELKNQLKISKQNETNVKKAPIGSVTANGGNKKAAADPFLAAWDED